MAIAEIIKYEGDNKTFVWKHPSEDFNSLTQLIVHESQEAIFMMNGQALDLFGPGRYTLETPVIRHLFTVKYILLIKQNRCLLNGGRIRKFSILSQLMDFRFQSVLRVRCHLGQRIVNGCYLN